MTDRYTKIVLTVIAGALLYICAVLSPMPIASAQVGSKYPGQPTGPAEVVVVGWKPNAPVPIMTTQPLQVVTERSTGAADRVILVGWEENTSRERTGATMRSIAQGQPGFPVWVRQP